eukprot:Colp12_sorted_trinity150504_noHs@2791
MATNEDEWHVCLKEVSDTVRPGVVKKLLDEGFTVTMLNSGKMTLDDVKDLHLPRGALRVFESYFKLHVPSTLQGAAPPATIEVPLQLIRKYELELEELKIKMAEMQKTQPFMQLAAELFSEKFTYSIGKATNASAVTTSETRNTIITFYGENRNSFKRKRKLRCFLLNHYFTASQTACSHIFKKEWESNCALVGLQSINQGDNLLLLYKPIEWAFDDSRLCFAYDAKGDTFTARLLDPSISNLRLSTKASQLLGKNYKCDQAMANMTFGQLDGMSLVFCNQNRPLKRLLCFHATMACHRAVENGWVAESSLDKPEFDYWSDGPDSEHIKSWLETANREP